MAFDELGCIILSPILTALDARRNVPAVELRSPTGTMRGSPRTQAEREKGLSWHKVGP